MNFQSDFLTGTDSTTSSGKSASSNSNVSLSNEINYLNTSNQANMTCMVRQVRTNSPPTVNSRLLTRSPMTTGIQQHQQQSNFLQHQGRPSYITINNSSLSSSPSSNSPSSLSYENNVNNNNNGYNSNSSLTVNNYMNDIILVPQLIDLMRRLKIKLIGFDFDCTIVNIHTGGQWLDSPEKLSEFVRPWFRDLLPYLLKCDDFYVCVVTYSPQEKLIREVLRILLKDDYEV